MEGIIMTKQNKKEVIWKPIKELDGYEVSNTGDVRVMYAPREWETERRYRILKRSRKGQYKRLSIKDDSYKFNYKLIPVQEIVIREFGKRIPNTRIVHIDGDTSNCDIDNLKQLTQEEISLKAKKENNLLQPEFKVVKCTQGEHLPIKEYDYYTDAAEDILAEQGYSKEDMTTGIVNSTLRNIRYAILHKEYPEAYGYYWDTKDRDNKKKGKKKVEEK